MARRTPVLPGLSRSSTCQRRALPGGCGRLQGHKGDCRPTLSAHTPAPKGPQVVLDRLVTTEGRTWNIVVFDDGTVTSTEVVESPAPTVARKARSAKPTDVNSAGGVEVLSADRYTVQEAKPRASRRARRPKVRTLKTVGPEGRDVQTIRGKSSRRRNYVASAKPSSRLA